MVTINTTHGMLLLQLIVEVVWLFLPALAANSAPVLAARYHWLPRLATPLDGDRLWRGQPVLGHSKTWRGVVVGLIFGSIAGVLQYALQPYLPVWLHPLLVYTSPLAAAVWGAWLGFGALAGDALKSFLKRRIAIAPGNSWKPFDQIDVVVGVLLAVGPFISLSFAHVILSFVVIGALMYATSIVGVKIKIKTAT